MIQERQDLLFESGIPEIEQEVWMFRVFCVAVVAIFLVTGCAGHKPGAGTIVDMKGVDPYQYQIDLAECEQYADQVAVGEQAAAGAAGGAVVGGLVGAIAKDVSAGRGAGVGAVVGGAKGTYQGVEERHQVVGNCLRNRGYAVLN
jgi:hypothetical protein